MLEQVMHGVLEGAGQQLLRQVNGEEAWVRIDVLVARHLTHSRLVVIAEGRPTLQDSPEFFYSLVSWTIQSLTVTLDTHFLFPPSDSPQQKAIAYVATRSHGDPLDPTLRVTVNFHPARFHRGVPLLRCLADDGEYRSQFETGTGNGGLSAYPGGERWHWETRLFGGAYDTTSTNERPKVGALNYRRRATGASPRFGSAHLRLR
ncbi:MAG TPA: DUF3626 domain-containing protein, partial [Polyangiales bacterium]|nr:DUF3626 domain-containing protein [Polyangiales bacterium]